MNTTNTATQDTATFRIYDAGACIAEIERGVAAAHVVPVRLNQTKKTTKENSALTRKPARHDHCW
jgi:hypothetical protein